MSLRYIFVFFIQKGEKKMNIYVVEYIDYKDRECKVYIHENTLQDAFDAAHIMQGLSSVIAVYKWDQRKE